jgi:sugar lactone lactonase YvrE
MVTVSGDEQRSPDRATVEVVLDGLTMGESPRWHDGRLWVCDWGTGEVLSVDGRGQRRVEAIVPSMPICIDWQPDGPLLVVSGGERRVLRQLADAAFEVLCDLAPLVDQPWNEIVVHDRGFAFVNTIGFDLMAGEPPASGVVAVVASDGSAHIVADDLAFPNGMTLTSDGHALLVAESYGARITAFDVAADGTLTGRRVWADVGEGAPDGLCLDAEGALWYADVPNRRCVRVRAGGEVLEVVETERGCFSCTLGGTDGRTLFLVTRTGRRSRPTQRPDRFWPTASACPSRDRGRARGAPGRQCRWRAAHR